MAEFAAAADEYSAADLARYERLVESVAEAARGLDTVALPDEVPGQRRRVLEAFDRAMRLLYRDGRLPPEVMLRAALGACGRGTARLMPLDWGRRHFVHQFLTREFVVDLAAFLERSPGPVLEVGAGRGDLARALRRWGVPIIATDGGSSLDGRLQWPRGVPDDVELLSYTAALARYRPACVLCAWMPLGEDWTPAFRACPSVRAYLLIGEGPGGCTGSAAAFQVAPGWKRTKLVRLGARGLTRNADRAFSASVYHFTRA